MGIWNVINKDVNAENETKRVIVTLRILYIVGLVACILDMCIAGVAVFRAFPYRMIGFLAGNVILFLLTYVLRTVPSLILFMLYFLAWTLLMIPCFGWSAGMQNYIIIILMLCFFAVHGKSRFKFMLAFFVLIVRIMVIGLFSGTKPVIEINSITDKLLQITNISAVFLSIILISYRFSQKENEEENKLMKYNDRLLREASTDRLTGLYNRRKAEECLSIIEASRDYPSVSLAMGDIDFFKKVNDTYGHDAGDEVLKYVAKTMTEFCPEGTIVSRWGGEEFLLIFPNVNGDDAFVTLDKLRHKIKKDEIKVGDEIIKITMTFGLSEYGFKSEIEESIKEADTKLYHGKENGRNQVVY